MKLHPTWNVYEFVCEENDRCSGGNCKPSDVAERVNLLSKRTAGGADHENRVFLFHRTTIVLMTFSGSVFAHHGTGCLIRQQQASNA